MGQAILGFIPVYRVAFRDTVLLFAASVTPSLVPRHYLAQGLLSGFALSGFALAVGYGVGTFFVWLWQFLELPKPAERIDWISRRLSTLAAVVILSGFPGK
jgi:uncharacterized membrane protein